MATFNPSAMGLPSDDEVERPSFEPPKDDWYDLHCVKTEKAEFQTNDGKTIEQLVFTIETMSGDPSERFQFRFSCNIVDPTERGLMNGLHKLNQLCKSVGMTGYNQMSDSDQVMGPVFRGYIVSKPQKKDPRYFNTNITKWQIDEDEEQAPAGGGQQAANTGGAANQAAEQAVGNWRDRAKQSA